MFSEGLFLQRFQAQFSGQLEKRIGEHLFQRFCGGCGDAAEKSTTAGSRGTVICIIGTSFGQELCKKLFFILCKPLTCVLE